MRPADQIGAVVRQSVREADAAGRSYADALGRHRVHRQPADITRRAARAELIAAAERDGAVIPRVLMPAETADVSPHEPVRARQKNAEEAEPRPPETSPAEPGFGVGWLTDR